MKIIEFELEDHLTGWRVERAQFNGFNLLVGISGVGKTRVLNALRTVRGIVTTQRPLPNGVSWRVTFEHDGVHYESAGATDALEPTELERSGGWREEREEAEAGPGIERESLRTPGEAPVFDRDAERFVFHGAQLPRLKTTESAIRLLSDEQAVAPVRQAFDRFVFEKQLFRHGSILALRTEKLSRYEERFKSLEALQKAPDMPLELRAFLLQRLHPEVFDRIKQDFLDIFGSVEDIEVRRGPSEDLRRHFDFPFWDEDLVMFVLKERGVPGWIPQLWLSSGMLRTLEMLVEVTLAPEGTVVMIDEFENSLGVNCMPQITDLLLSRAAELQFIVTSHHPYIIEHIPMDTWKLVTRKGTTVRLMNAFDVPELASGSRHDRFIRLLNVPAFLEGVQ